MSVGSSSRVTTFIRRYLAIATSVSVVLDSHNIHAR